MGDVAGFVGLFYQVKPMREVSIAGKTSTSMEFLEDQGPKIARAKERHQIVLETMKFSQAIGSSKSLTPPPAVKKYDNNANIEKIAAGPLDQLMRSWGYKDLDKYKRLLVQGSKGRKAVRPSEPEGADGTLKLGHAPPRN
ncbi:MAG: hypothetical protein JOS17DRAFT_818066 [Linnemannia elongata]|nr:MAG: hypothetical protein JOS17DRAFT_818066 [Linnemannia elongata]